MSAHHVFEARILFGLEIHGYPFSQSAQSVAEKFRRGWQVFEWCLPFSMAFVDRSFSFANFQALRHTVSWATEQPVVDSLFVFVHIQLPVIAMTVGRYTKTENQPARRPVALASSRKPFAFQMAMPVSGT